MLIGKKDEIITVHIRSPQISLKRGGLIDFVASVRAVANTVVYEDFSRDIETCLKRLSKSL